MGKETPKARLKREFRSLFRSMDFVADNYLRGNDRPDKTVERFAEVYQQLGVAWEYLALHCKHWDGYRKAREGKMACRICGKIKGTDEHWLLLPGKGPKRIGRRATPTSKEVFPTEKQALVVADTIAFHGATLEVKVCNAHKSRLSRRIARDITIAADRIIKLREGHVECWLDTHLVHVRWKPEPRGKRAPTYGAFPWELTKARLKNFPIILEHDAKGRFTGLTILEPASSTGKGRGKPRKRMVL
ncbi:MAG TPA: hypothetical protein VNE39_08645 [Planctomycetota bacterium]|nr:hypothetical protein [Planctomycetota bacterium]